MKGVDVSAATWFMVAMVITMFAVTLGITQLLNMAGVNQQYTGSEGDYMELKDKISKVCKDGGQEMGDAKAGDDFKVVVEGKTIKLVNFVEGGSPEKKAELPCELKNSKVELAGGSYRVKSKSGEDKFSLKKTG